MRSTARWILTVTICALALAPAMVPADPDKHQHPKLPPGPISDRHDLMESMGQNAEDINNAFNLGSEGFDVALIQREALVLSNAAAQIPSLFPKGSTDPNSRALPAIWQNWDKFQGLAKSLQDSAMSLSNAAAAGDDENLKEKSQKVFANCKSCHDQFRKPKDKKKQ
jgi:cytochrome c556